MEASSFVVEECLYMQCAKEAHSVTLLQSLKATQPRTHKHAHPQLALCHLQSLLMCFSCFPPLPNISPSSSTVSLYHLLSVSFYSCFSLQSLFVTFWSDSHTFFKAVLFLTLVNRHFKLVQHQKLDDITQNTRQFYNVTKSLFMS